MNTPGEREVRAQIAQPRGRPVPAPLPSCSSGLSIRCFTSGKGLRRRVSVNVIFGLSFPNAGTENCLEISRAPPWSCSRSGFIIPGPFGAFLGTESVFKAHQLWAIIKMLVKTKTVLSLQGCACAPGQIRGVASLWAPHQPPSP